MKFNGKKLFLVGFVVVLLVGIPLTVYLLQQQQEVRSHAEKSTNLAFSPDSTTAAPIQKAVGDSIPLDIVVDPGKNLVSYVKLEIQYDPTILATASADAFKVNSTAFPSVLEGPIYTPGKIAVSMSVGPDSTKAIQQKVTAATVTFTALNTTAAGTPTMVTFTTNTEALSAGPESQASENVLLNPLPAAIQIGAGAGYSTPTASVSATPTVAVTPTAGPSPTPPPPSAPPPPPITSSTPPVCGSLTVDRATTGTAPFSLTFTANGNASSSGTISKVSFNFGDGQVSDVTNSGGIGTSSVNVQASHTYNAAGTYQATALLTDSAGGVSTPANSCSQTITVTTASGSATTTGGGTTISNPTPTMPPTGSTEIAIGAGIGALALIIGGALIFFIL